MARSTSGRRGAAADTEEKNAPAGTAEAVTEAASLGDVEAEAGEAEAGEKPARRGRRAKPATGTATDSSGKDPAAFRTIREVSELLGVPQHVLRFWETRFPELKPLQRGGNRRYYRPSDVAFASALHKLLHQDGFTVKGVRKLITENGAANLVAIAEGAAVVPRKPGTRATTRLAIVPGDETAAKTAQPAGAPATAVATIARAPAGGTRRAEASGEDSVIIPLSSLMAMRDRLILALAA